MAKKTTKLRPWTKEDVRVMRALAREKVKTSVIARKLKRSVGATYQQASKHGVTLGTSRKKERRKSHAKRVCRRTALRAWLRLDSVVTDANLKDGASIFIDIHTRAGTGLAGINP
jgi:hypothetical protein